MALSTRAVLAFMVIGLLSAALVAHRVEAGSLASWLMTAGFAVASLWAGLGVVWTYERGPEGVLSPQVYLSLLMAGIAFTTYFAVRARDGQGLVGGW